MRKTNIISHMQNQKNPKFIEKDKRLVVASDVRGWGGNWVKAAKRYKLTVISKF